MAVGFFDLGSLVDLNGVPIDASAAMYAAPTWTDSFAPTQQALDMWTMGDTLNGGVPDVMQLAALDNAASPVTADAIAHAQQFVNEGAAPPPSDLALLYNGLGIPYSPADIGVQNGLGALLSPSGNAAMAAGAGALRPFASSGSNMNGGDSGSGGSGGGVGISAPSISSPVAATIPRLTPPSMPNPGAPIPFQPMSGAIDLSPAARLVAAAAPKSAPEDYLPESRRYDQARVLAELFR